MLPGWRSAGIEGWQKEVATHFSPDCACDSRECSVTLTRGTAFGTCHCIDCYAHNAGRANRPLAQSHTLTNLLSSRLDRQFWLPGDRGAVSWCSVASSVPCIAVPHLIAGSDMVSMPDCTCTMPAIVRSCLR